MDSGFPACAFVIGEPALEALSVWHANIFSGDATQCLKTHGKLTYPIKPIWRFGFSLNNGQQLLLLLKDNSHLMSHLYKNYFPEKSSFLGVKRLMLLNFK